MIDFGKTLREAREAKGFSVSQLAERTHILPQIIESLEHEDVKHIVAPIYGRGFVKLYCEAVGIDDPQPLINEFMDIYNGNRPPVIRRRETATAKSIADEPAAEVPPMAEPVAESVAESAPEPIIRSKAELNPEPVKPLPKTPPVRDYRPPVYSMPEVPRSIWRFGLLAAAGLLALALLYFGARAVYRLTMTTPTSAPTSENAQKPPQNAEKSPTAPAANDETAATPRKPISIPPLYID